jgi:hypothetical protein
MDSLVSSELTSLASHSVLTALVSPAKGWVVSCTQSSDSTRQVRSLTREIHLEELTPATQDMSSACTQTEVSSEPESELPFVMPTSSRMEEQIREAVSPTPARISVLLPTTSNPSEATASTHKDAILSNKPAAKTAILAAINGLPTLTTETTIFEEFSTLQPTVTSHTLKVHGETKTLC